MLGAVVMKSLIRVAAISAVLMVPVASFAQTNGPVTRAQVRAELVQLEKAGYHPGDGDQNTYPAPIQAAEAKVAAANESSSGYGSVANGTSNAARPLVSQADWNAMYNRP